MLKSLYWKLTLAFMLVAITTAALLAIFIRLNSVDRLTQLIIDQRRSDFEEALTQYYTDKGSWEGIAAEWANLQFQPGNKANDPGVPDGPPPGGGGPFSGERRRLFGLADAQGNLIIPLENNQAVGSKAADDLLKAGVQINVDGKMVGTILTARRLPGFNPEERLFLERTNQALSLAILGALIVALLVGVLLARTLTGPLQALTRAAQNIAQGKLDQQVQVKSKDEIGQLASAFNRMSQEVARVNQLRRQMTADIAHDLRTPLTVIAGYVESMRDGVLQPTTQRLSLIYSEIERLQRLVGDLRMLTQADAGELSLHAQRISPHTLLERAVALFQHQAERQKIRLAVKAGENLPEILVDEARMMQVMDNLLSNAFRYTPEGGEIQLSAEAADGKVRFSVRDTGPGIAAQELPYIFDRFHRSDKSRHTENGESGLGLAIVKALVESHQGSVWAESQEEAGTAIYFEVPEVVDGRG